MLNLLQELPQSGANIEPSSIAVEEYHRRIDAGELTPNDKVQLIRGRLVDKMPRSPIHVFIVESILERVRSLLPTGWFARTEKPITLTDSEPEPDLVVVRGMPRDYKLRHPQPSDLSLVVEVSSSSYSFDRTTKLDLYAEAGVPCYWVVNLNDNQIEVFQEPSEGIYKRIVSYSKDEPVPIPLDGREIGRLALSEIAD